MGHDLGHAPFGHSGERALNEACTLGFEHPEQSLRVVEVLENNMKGLNLTEETKDGILNHRSSGTPSTLEGKAVQLSDKIAYLHHDVDDAIRAGILTEDDIPAEIKAAAGEDSNQRLKFLVGDIVNHSLGTDEVKMSEKGMEILTAMRNWMFDAVYTNPKAKGEEEKAEGVVRTLYYYFLENPEKLPEEYLNLAKRDDLLERTVCDYVSSMTDSYAADMYSYIFMPTPWTIDLKS